MSESLVRQQERQADFLEAEAARIRAELEQREKPGLLGPPYCQVIGKNAIVLLRPDQIDFIIYAMQDYGFTHETARSIEGEMWRAQRALKYDEPIEVALAPVSETSET